MKAADNYLRITTVCLKVGQELVWLPKLRRFLCKLKHQKAEDVPRFLWPNGCETLCRNLQCCRGQDLGIRGLTSDLFLEHWNDIDAFGRVVGRIALKRCRPSRTSTLGLLRVKVLMLFSLSWALALTSPHCWGSFFTHIPQSPHFVSFHFHFSLSEQRRKRQKRRRLIRFVGDTHNQYPHPPTHTQIYPQNTMSLHVCISKPLPGLSVITGRLCVDAAKEIAADNDGCTRTWRSSPSSGPTPPPLLLFELDLFIRFEENVSPAAQNKTR